MLPQYLDSVINIIDPQRIALEVAAKCVELFVRPSMPCSNPLTRLSLVHRYIETEKFWKRLCGRWKNCQPEHHGSSWKRYVDAA